MKRAVCLMILILVGSVPAHSSLLGRAPATPGGTDYQAYYDTTLKITWLADANLLATNGFGLPDNFYYSDGRMDWNTAQSWIAAMNAQRYLGVNDWRLPAVVDTGNTGCDWAYTGTDCGYGVQTTGDSGVVYSEMASLYYDTLGNRPYVLPDGSYAPSWGLVNSGPFLHLQADNYWSGTEYAPYAASNAWGFYFFNGTQNFGDKSQYFHLWTVHPGDIVAVPLPASLPALISGLATCLRLLRRKPRAV